MKSGLTYVGIVKKTQAYVSTIRLFIITVEWRTDQVRFASRVPYSDLTGRRMTLRYPHICQELDLETVAKYEDSASYSGSRRHELGLGSTAEAVLIFSRADDVVAVIHKLYVSGARFEVYDRYRKHVHL